MSKYTFFNVPAWGHVNPTLAVAQELVKRGHEVSYYLTEEFRETIQATGARFEPYESASMVNVASSSPARGAGPTGFMQDLHSVPTQIIDRVRAQSPDVILYDFMGTWAKPIIETLQVPAIALRPTYASNEHYNSVQNMPSVQAFIERIKARIAQNNEQGETVPPSQIEHMFSIFSSFEQFNIMFIPRFFQPMEETFDERFLFVGPSILPRHQETSFPFDQLRNDLPLLYISLGSIATNQPDFYQHCFEAFGDQAWQVVLTVGKQIDTTRLGPIPANFLLSPYVPQLDILPRAQVFVTHAGANSVMESMYYGVPLVLIPQQPEQHMNAQRVVELGLGTLLDKDSVTAATLHDAVDHIAQNTSYREHAQSMRQATRDAGGYQRAADAIIQFTQEHTSPQSRA